MEQTNEVTNDFESNAAARLFTFLYRRTNGETISPHELIALAKDDAEFSEAWLAYALAANSHPHEVALALACARLHGTSGYQYIVAFWQLAEATLAIDLASVQSEYRAVCQEFRLPEGIDEQALRAYTAICANLTTPLEHRLAAGTVTTTSTNLPVERFNDLIHFASSRMDSTKVYDDSGKAIEYTDVRNNDQCLTILPRIHPVIACFERYLANMYQVPVQHAESLVIYRYREGQQFKWHYDYITAQSEQVSQELATLGQRVRTAILYLNDGFEGGRTEFQRLDLSLRGKLGDVVSFANMQADGSLDKDSLHRGSVVTDGEKWIATVWFRSQPNWLRTGLLF